MKKSKKPSKPQNAKVQKLLVITQGGRVVGTQAIGDPKPRARSTAMLRPGPGQQQHVLEIESPAKFSSAQDIHGFHEAIARRLQIAGDGTR